MQARAPETTPYPADAVAWLAGDPAVDGSRTVVCLGAPEPDPVLADALTTLGHDVRTGEGGPALPGDSVDVVVAVHGPPADLDEVVRVLRPGGRIAFVVPERDTRIPWVRKLDRIVGTDRATAPEGGPAEPVVTHGSFGWVEDTTVRFWQQVDRPTLLTLVARLPGLRALDDAEREQRIAAAGELYDGYGRGPDGMQLPWVARCYRARLSEEGAATDPHRDRDGGADPDGGGGGTAPAVPGEPGRDLAADTDMLLIDFR